MDTNSSNSNILLDRSVVGMKKVIVIAYDLNPKLGSEAGNACIWLNSISKQYKVEVFINKKHEKDIDIDKYKNVNFNFIKINSIILKSLEKMRLYNILYNIFIKKVDKIIQKKIKIEKYELIHCLTPAGIHSYNDLYKYKIPIIIGPLGGALPTPKGFETIFKKEHMREFLRNKYYKQLQKNRAWNKYFSTANRIIIGTPYIYTILPKECHNKTSIVFDTIVDPSIFKSRKIKKTDNINICYSGNLTLKKGTIMLLEAFNNLKKQRKIKDNVNITIAGDGPQYRNLQKYVKKKGIQKNVFFLGAITRSEIIEQLQKSDIFCLPTLREPGGGSILEAMSCELPIITTDYGGPAYSVTEKCGIKIKPSTYEQYVKDLEKAIYKLINNKKLRIQMGFNGRKRIIKNFSPKSLEKNILKIYSDILNRALE